MRGMQIAMCCIWISSFAAEKKLGTSSFQDKAHEQILDLSKSRKWAIKDKKNGVISVDRYNSYKKKVEKNDQQSDEYEELCISF